VSVQVSSEAADLTSPVGGDVSAVVMTTAAIEAVAETLDSDTVGPSVATVDQASCSEAVSITELTSTATPPPLTTTHHSAPVRLTQSTTVAEEPTCTDEQLQCSECKKSFRSQTLLDYHNKYYHHVAVTDRRRRVAHRRTSLPALRPSSSVERGPSGRFRSKNKSMCMCTAF